jgi:hypothetical protein
MDRDGPDKVFQRLDYYEAQMIEHAKKKSLIAQAFIKAASINPAWTPRAFILEAIELARKTPPSSPPENL